ncbi:MAG: hypothetical protein KJO11_02325, partial [Gemmatimonadetes bacterium]|nr:hypothetical protein [Gemmatimonadota bacterium]
MPQGVNSRLATTGRRPQRARAARRLRATWYHVAALGREFRVPLIGFFVAIVIGGFVYGELHAWARGAADAIPYFDRPYTM